MRNSHYRRMRSGKRSASGNLILGIVLLAVGGLLFAREFGAELPSWLFRWELILVVVGISIGIKSRFRDFGWIAVTGVGLFFLSDDIFPGWDASRFIVPVSILALGAFIILTRLSYSARRQELNQHPDHQPEINAEGVDEDNPLTGERQPPQYSDRQQPQFGERQQPQYQPTTNQDSGQSQFRIHETASTQVHPGQETLDIVSVFSALNRKVFSKNFVGGEIVCVFGGAEVNLMNADIAAGTIELEVVCIFGGATLFIPPNWHVIAEMGSVFGGVDDKRKNAVPDQNKTIVIKGVCIFGGLEIKTKFQ